MTLIQKITKANGDAMDCSTAKEDSGKPLRPVRNRRYTRRSLVAGQRPQKRLFTPEIKRYLKDWLVRRRENPYPNREEKKNLAKETGLTYIQICNWFANWRRKLKSVNADRNQQTWGHLIRTYNDRAQGNVEQFSICSEDSIWSELEQTSPERDYESLSRSLDINRNYSYQYDDSNSSTTSKERCDSYSYPAESRVEETCNSNKSAASPILLSKWLESAARFQPSEMNYSWWGDGKQRRAEPSVPKAPVKLVNQMSRHDRDEVEAAVALTALACASSRLTAQ